MGEEVKDEEVKDEEVKDEDEKKESPDVQALAKQLGWNPDYEGDDRKYVSASDYILRSKEIQSTMTKQLKDQKKQMDELKMGLSSLKEHNETVFKVHVARLKKELNDLKVQRKEAKEDGDESRVAELDDQIKDISKMPSELPKSANKPHPDFTKWLDKNDWYMDNEEMREYADAQAKDPKFEGLSPAKTLTSITKRVKDMFPDEFPKEPERPTAAKGTIEKPTSPKKSKTKFSVKDLTDEQKTAAKFFEKQGVMTTDEYIKELESIGQLA